MKVMEFFKRRIGEQYPLVTVEEDIAVRSRKHHEAFMLMKADRLLGRDSILSQVCATQRSCN